MPIIARHLLSPNRRRIVDAGDIGADAVQQLVKLGWTPYAGTAQAVDNLDEHATTTILGVKNDTAASGVLHKGTRNGWIVPGTDPKVDAQRITRTGRETLGPSVVA